MVKRKPKSQRKPAPKKATPKSGAAARTAALQAAFLAAYPEVGTITAAATAAGINRCTHIDWLESDPTYPARFAQAQDEALEVLEAEARRRAVRGVRRLKFFKGAAIIDPKTGEQYYEHEYSDTLAIFLMKGLAPHKYRDNVHSTVDAKVEHAGTVALYLPDNGR